MCNILFLYFGKIWKNLHPELAYSIFISFNDFMFLKVTFQINIIVYVLHQVFLFVLLHFATNWHLSFCTFCGFLQNFLLYLKNTSICTNIDSIHLLNSIYVVLRSNFILFSMTTICLFFLIDLPILYHFDLKYQIKYISFNEIGVKKKKWPI